MTFGLLAEGVAELEFVLAKVDMNNSYWRLRFDWGANCKLLRVRAARIPR